MPATDSFFRNQKILHIAFALTAVALFVGTLMMLAKDHDDEWRDTQRTFYQLEALKLEQAQNAVSQSPEYQEDLASAQKDVKQAEADLKEQEDQLDDAKSELKKRQTAFSIKDQQVRFTRAERDKAKADYGLSIAQNASKSEQNELLESYNKKQAEVDQLELELEEHRGELQKAQAAVNAITAEKVKAEENLKKVRADFVRAHDALVKIQPEGWLPKAKRTIMEWPIIDGFNSHLSVRQDWLPDLPIRLGMASTARFDRCRTCHLGIDMTETGGVPKYPFGIISDEEAEVLARKELKYPEDGELTYSQEQQVEAKIEEIRNDPHSWVKANRFPHPYATHPRPELYTTATSPHPVTTFGCTTCHEGQGSGTSFNNAAHSAADPVIAGKWEEEYQFHPNHFWEYPMLPERFQEASCIKCHHQVTELAVNPRFETSAPKVHRGFQLIKEFGCFGCHEIHGYEAGKSIGPDLRLEPPTLAEARWAVRKELGILPEDTPTPRQEALIEEKAAVYADDTQKGVGTLRKVGPALTHINSKTTLGWVEYWTEMPSRFRPDTRMPQFFHLTNQQDETAEEFQPIEIAGIASYLMTNSRELDLFKPEEGYEPDPDRGKELFAQRGCLACHTHDDKTFQGNRAEFGPNLTRVHEKIKPGEEGFNWLYTWIKEPTRHHPRTRMPDLFLDPYELEGEVVDPAADIAAFLLEGKGPTEYELAKVDEESLDKMVRLYLEGKALNFSQTDEMMKTRVFPKKRKQVRETNEFGEPVYDIIKGDEIELTTVDGHIPTEEEWTQMKLNYVGRRTISRYGCYGCHNIPGFEDARPIGTALQDWGRKDPSKLAPEHIEEYLHHHGEVDGSSTAERIQNAMKKAASDEYTSEQLREEEMDLAFYYESLIHHGRPGFIWQKLRAPRSYDYKTIETKKYDERLRMPKFTFSLDEELNRNDREAIITFVLGLIADPPPEKYLYTPSEQERIRIEGEQLIEKFNCSGCHMLDMPMHTLAANIPDLLLTAKTREQLYQEAAEKKSAYHVHGLDLLLSKFKPPREISPSTLLELEPAQEGDEPVKGMQLSLQGLQMLTPMQVEDNEGYGIDLWETVQVNTMLVHGFKPLGKDEDAGEAVEALTLQLAELFPESSANVAQVTPAVITQNQEQETVWNILSEEDNSLLRSFTKKNFPAAEAGAQGVYFQVELYQSGPIEELVGLASRGRLYGKSWKDLTIVDLQPKDNLLVPGTRVFVDASRYVAEKPGRGGEFATWLVNYLAEEVTNENTSLAWQMAPPPLYQEGLKVQTSWLYHFLRQPYTVRQVTVLRMPKFNMTAHEAQVLANYFAAKDDEDYPYQPIPQRNPEYLQERSLALESVETPSDYLHDSWKLLNGQVCIGCHSVGNRPFKRSSPNDVRGPNLELAHDRLAPDWLMVWLYNPKWITPYTSMPAVFGNDKTSQYTKIFDGNPTDQTIGLRDALMNYHFLMERYPNTVYDPTKVAETSEQGNNNQPPNPNDPAQSPNPVNPEPPNPVDPDNPNPQNPTNPAPEPAAPENNEPENSTPENPQPENTPPTPDNPTPPETNPGQ